MREHPHLELSENSYALRRSWGWSERDVRTTIANASAWVRSWSVNAWLAPGVSGTSNASARASGAAAGSQGSEVELMDKPLEKQPPLGPHRGIAQSHRNPLRGAE